MPTEPMTYTRFTRHEQHITARGAHAAFTERVGHMLERGAWSTIYRRFSTPAEKAAAKLLIEQLDIAAERVACRIFADPRYRLGLTDGELEALVDIHRKGLRLTPKEEPDPLTRKRVGT